MEEIVGHLMASTNIFQIKKINELIKSEMSNQMGNIPTIALKYSVNYFIMYRLK